MSHQRGQTGSESGSVGSPRQSWTRPTITELPRLTDLTLQTSVGPPIGGSGTPGGGGSGVFP